MLVTPPSIEHVGCGLGEFEYVHVNVYGVDVFGATVVGVTLNVPITGAAGSVFKMTCRCDMPARLLHVSVISVMPVIVTDTGVPLVTVPTPLSIVHVGSGYVGWTRSVHENVTIVGVFAANIDGDAVSDVIDGANSGASGVPITPLSFRTMLPSSPHAASANARTSSLVRIAPPTE